MKYTASKWPVTITYEIAEDWFDGINPKQVDCTPCDNVQDLIQAAADEAADQFIKAKGLLLAQQEAKRKQQSIQPREDESNL